MPGCPVELEALVTRKFTAYNTYVRLYSEIPSCTSLDQCAVLARRLIDAYIDNRDIWQELDYYKQHGVVLGKHHAFTEFRRRRELNKLSVIELYKRAERIRGNIWRAQSEIDKGDRPHLDAERQQRIEAYKRELQDIERLLQWTSPTST